MKHMIILLALFALGTQALLAQDATMIAPEEAVDIPRVLSLIHSVEGVEQDSSSALLIFGTMPDGCERDTLVTKERQGDVLFVDVYHEPVPASVAGCPKMLIPIALTIPTEELLLLDENTTLPTLLVVNDHYYAINIAQIEPTSQRLVPPMTLSPLTRTELSGTEVSSQAHPGGGVDVTIKGSLPEGCTDPVHSRVRPHPETNEYTIDLFRAIYEPFMCPETYVAVAFEKVVTLPADADSKAVFFIDQISYTYTPSPSETGVIPVRVPHTIESVEALLLESFPVQILLQVKGYQPDGCEMPVRIEQSREGNTITVEIFRELPPDASCPQVIKTFDNNIKLDGGFESGTYTIDVNGTVITVKI